MPQMAPMLWLSLFMFFILVYIIFLIFNFFSPLPLMIKSPKKNKTPINFTWKW